MREEVAIKINLPESRVQVIVLMKVNFKQFPFVLQEKTVLLSNILLKIFVYRTTVLLIFILNHFLTT